MDVTEKYGIGDRVEFTDEDGNVVQGEVRGIQAWQQAKYAVRTEGGVCSQWEHGLRPAGQS